MTQHEQLVMLLHLRCASIFHNKTEPVDADNDVIVPATQPFTKRRENYGCSGEVICYVPLRQLQISALRHPTHPQQQLSHLTFNQRQQTSKQTEGLRPGVIRQNDSRARQTLESDWRPPETL
ncbi:hypothetical protein PoB_006178500 [Plakobranchus ocellatus]|uniref:Uncharacterized protein n=1 Tax=Plakobranchus ocellatus TaxID=259542 RepID=A0AAV4CTQ0_9GAST|nr:hypothetical protein PoB_006178500 [Plakobranchus ocellatus]